MKIALNAGHGRYTAGKRCMRSLDPNETREWVLNSRICDKVEAKLKAYKNCEILRLDDTTGKTDISLTNRTNKANAFGADFYLAIHHNAGIGGGEGGGIEAYVYLKVDAESKSWQNALYNAIVAETGLRGNRSQPLRADDLHEVRESCMPAVLLELGYMDSSTDVPIILTDKFAEGCANAIVKVIVAKGKLEKRDSESTKVNASSANTFTTGAKLTLTNACLYASSTAKTDSGKKTGTYYIWSDTVINNRIRITNSKANVGKTGQVTGWINCADAKAYTDSTTSASQSTFAPYMVKVVTNELNIRKGAGTNCGINGSIKDQGVYTIVAESAGQGATKWGKLKSGKGWISLDYTKRV